MRDTVIVCGNGLPIDLRNQFPDLPDTSNPLQTKIIPNHHMWDGFMVDFNVEKHFSYLLEVMSNAENNHKFRSDYDIIAFIVSAPSNHSIFKTNFSIEHKTRMSGSRFLAHEIDDKFKEIVVAQLRLYLMYVYSYYDMLTNNTDTSNWKWALWIKANSHRISHIASFNYDILIEKIFCNPSAADYITSHFDLQKDYSSIQVSKPHGSVNHIVENVIDIGQIYLDYPARPGSISIIGGPITILPKNNLNSPRLFSDIVLPSEAPGLRRRLPQIAFGYQRINNIGRRAKFLIIAGISYWDCDREEIEEIINALPSAKILICNPHPPKALSDYLYRRGRYFVELKTEMPII